MEKQERKDTRVERRLKAKTQKVLDDLVKDFLERRSAEKDPDGEVVDNLFKTYREAWFTKCINFNKLKFSIKLRYEAFAESVNYFIEEERKNMKKFREENRIKKQEVDFRRWYKNSYLWRTRPLTSLLYWFKSGGDRGKMEQLWKSYFMSNVLDKND
jgi:hypothetical protein